MELDITHVLIDHVLSVPVIVPGIGVTLTVASITEPGSESLTVPSSGRNLNFTSLELDIEKT